VVGIKVGLEPVVADDGVAAEISISRARFPEAAVHIETAQAAGHPSVLTIDRGGAAANRLASTGGYAKVPGLHLDEYPPAMFREGGAGASVRAIDPRQNMGAGACIGNACRAYPNGSQVRILVAK
jgi:filamentous hemagglutinin